MLVGTFRARNALDFSVISWKKGLENTAAAQTVIEGREWYATSTGSCA
jgi:hypothetical protein